MAALKRRLRPRFVVLRLRGFSLIFGMSPALKMHFRLCAESKPPSRLNIRSGEGRPDLFGYLFQRFEALREQDHIRLIDGRHGDGR